jgi:hypothetical protein
LAVAHLPQILEIETFDWTLHFTRSTLTNGCFNID